MRSYSFTLLFFLVLGFTSQSLGGDPIAGEKRYGESCVNCHGPAGMGVASYPKISGKEVSYVTAMLETYRDGIEVGPNSSLMIMMAMPLTDEEIANLAAYLKDAKYQQPNLNK
jgi:cytochrome c553